MIISNATPLIAFSRIGRLDLLRQTVAEPLVIPAAVADELSDYERGEPGSIDLANEAWIQTQFVKDEQQVHLLLPTLDRGEAQVIALGLERQARLVLIDELIGRKVAESLGLRLTGSVGILIRAKQLGEITAIKPLLEQMVREGPHKTGRTMPPIAESRTSPAPGDHRATGARGRSRRPGSEWSAFPRPGGAL